MSKRKEGKIITPEEKKTDFLVHDLEDLKEYLKECPATSLEKYFAFQFLLAGYVFNTQAKIILELAKKFGVAPQVIIERLKDEGYLKQLEKEDK
jgi:Zn-dependent peptidase ImmA (M78 family)